MFGPGPERGSRGGSERSFSMEGRRLWAGSGPDLRGNMFFACSWPQGQLGFWAPGTHPQQTDKTSSMFRCKRPIYFRPRSLSCHCSTEGRWEGARFGLLNIASGPRAGLPGPVLAGKPVRMDQNPFPNGPKVSADWDRTLVRSPWHSGQSRPKTGLESSVRGPRALWSNVKCSPLEGIHC